MALSMRARLIGMCVAITSVSLLALAAVNFVSSRSSAYAAVDAGIGQAAAHYAQNLGLWGKKSSA